MGIYRKSIDVTRAMSGGLQVELDVFDVREANLLQTSGPAALAARLETEARKRWQPQIRARIGYTAPIGTTDDARLRHLTVALAPQYAARLFDAQERGATGQRLQAAGRTPPAPGHAARSSS